MNSQLPVLFFFAASLTLSAQTEEQIDKHFTVSPNGRLVVDVGAGSIEVATHAGNDVIVTGYRKVSRRDKTEEETYLRDHPVSFSQDGNAVTVQARDKNNLGSGWFGSNRMEAKYIITVPTTFNLELKTSGGGIAASDVTGTVNANTSGGGLKFARLHGPLDCHTSGGGIRIDACEGTLKIQTSGGGIEVTGGGGSLAGSTSGGGVTVRDFHGTAQVHTSGGGITLENITGRVEGSTSGGPITARFSTPLTDEVKLETSGGGVNVRVATGSAFNLDAATSGGSVSTDLPVTVVGKISRGSLSGTVNGGGKTMYLRSSGGGIQIKTI